MLDKESECPEYSEFEDELIENHCVPSDDDSDCASASSKSTSASVILEQISPQNLAKIEFDFKDACMFAFELSRKIEKYLSDLETSTANNWLKHKVNLLQVVLSKSMCRERLKELTIENKTPVTTKINYNRKIGGKRGPGKIPPEKNKGLKPKQLPKRANVTENKKDRIQKSGVKTKQPKAILKARTLQKRANVPKPKNDALQKPGRKSTTSQSDLQAPKQKPSPPKKFDVAKTLGISETGIYTHMTSSILESDSRKGARRSDRLKKNLEDNDVVYCDRFTAMALKLGTPSNRTVADIVQNTKTMKKTPAVKKRASEKPRLEKNTPNLKNKNNVAQKKRFRSLSPAGPSNMTKKRATGSLDGVSKSDMFLKNNIKRNKLQSLANLETSSGSQACTPSPSKSGPKRKLYTPDIWLEKLRLDYLQQ